MKTEQKTMRKVKNLLSSQARLVTVVLALLIFSTLALGARAWLRAPIETVTVTVHANGFTPSETIRAAGSFTLAVDNQSGIDSLTLKLVRDGGEMVQEIAVPQGTHTLSTELNLAAGGYTLTESNHPAWLFHITAQ